MGARGIGHIRYLTELTPPRIGLVLNVGSAHLGELGSREAIAQAKGEMVEGLPRGAAAPCSTPTTRSSAPWPRARRRRVLLFGEAPEATARGEKVR